MMPRRPAAALDTPSPDAAAPASPPWTAHKIEQRKVAALRAAPNNPRTHSAKQIEQLVAAIREWGFTIPLLVTGDGEIIAGHGRWMAAKQAGLVKVPCIVADHWTDAQRRAYVLADNQLAANSAWDIDLAATEMIEIEAAGFDLAKIGFSESQLAGFFTPEPDEIRDGLQGSGEGKSDGAFGVMVVVGPYRQSVTREQMEVWLAMIRAEGNDDKNEINAVILNRLGIS